MRRTLVGVGASLVAVAAIPGGIAGAQACPVDLPQGSEPVTLDPADFVAEIDNPYWPMAPGTQWVYRETDGEGGAQRVKVTVTTSPRVTSSSPRASGRAARASTRSVRSALSS